MAGGPRGPTSQAAAAYYDDRIGADLFAEEEARLAVAIKAAQCESATFLGRVDRGDDVAPVLAALDIERRWAAATEVE